MNRYRHEYKYMIDACQKGILEIRAGGVARLDPHVGKDGTYLIRSVYFDDSHDNDLKDTLNGVDPRSKYRMRYYNDNTERILLEKKSKRRLMCLKETCELRTQECLALLEGRVPLPAPDDSAVKKKLLCEMQRRGMTPKVIVTYRRKPFIYPAGNVRITFDYNITSSRNLDRFLKGDYAQRPILASGSSILEIKWDELIPDYIRQAFHIDRLQWTAFSKYSMCRTLHM